METITMEKKVWKECGSNKTPTIAEVIGAYKEPKKILIVFWHGVGDLLMFLPLYKYMKHLFVKHTFDLGLIPAVGHKHIVPEGLELPEKDFLKDHDACFVISFPMIEGSNTMTKVEYCAQLEVGLKAGVFESPYLTRLPILEPTKNKLIGVHFQGTCLPGSTNPEEDLARKIWDDIRLAGYVPIDLHMEHAFHNPVNKPYSWASRTCRDLVPSLSTLKMIIEQCHAVVAVASGPFVLSLCINQARTIFLQKHHKAECYVYGFTQVVDILNYDRENLIKMLNGICVV